MRSSLSSSYRHTRLWGDLCKIGVAAVSMQSPQEGAQSLDRLVRDIVVEQRHFDYSVLPGEMVVDWKTASKHGP